MKWLPAITLLLFFVSSTAGAGFPAVGGSLRHSYPAPTIKPSIAAATDGTVPITLHNPDAERAKAISGRMGQGRYGVCG